LDTPAVTALDDQLRICGLRLGAGV